MLHSLLSVTHRGVQADHFIEDKKYMIWYHKPNKYKYEDTVGIIQVRGLTKPLTESELRGHIDKLWERYYGLQQ